MNKFKQINYSGAGMYSAAFQNDFPVHMTFSE